MSRHWRLEHDTTFLEVDPNIVDMGFDDHVFMVHESTGAYVAAPRSLLVPAAPPLPAPGVYRLGPVVVHVCRDDDDKVICIQHRPAKTTGFIPWEDAWKMYGGRDRYLSLIISNEQLETTEAKID